jgi:hypothetical protein
MAADIIRVQQYLGDDLINEAWLSPTNNVDMAWLAFWEHDVEEHLHPEVRLAITHYKQLVQFVVKPKNPRPLSEILGEETT